MHLRCTHAACGLCGFPPEFEAVPEASSESEPGADLEPELDLVAGNAHGAGRVEARGRETV